VIMKLRAFAASRLYNLTLRKLQAPIAAAATWLAFIRISGRGKSSQLGELHRFKRLMREAPSPMITKHRIWQRRGFAVLLSSI